MAYRELAAVIELLDGSTAETLQQAADRGFPNPLPAVRSLRSAGAALRGAPSADGGAHLRPLCSQDRGALMTDQTRVLRSSRNIALARLAVLAAEPSEAPAIPVLIPGQLELFTEQAETEPCPYLCDHD